MRLGWGVSRIGSKGVGREPPIPRALMSPSEANRSAITHLCVVLPDSPPSKLQALTRMAKPPQCQQETEKEDRQMKSLKGQVAAENPGPCLQGQRECPEPIPCHFHSWWEPSGTVHPPHPQEAFSQCYSLCRTHLCFYFHVWQSQGPRYRKSDPELDVERTPAHLPPISTQKIKAKPVPAALTPIFPGPSAQSKSLNKD